MDTTIIALRNLYVALGGEATAVENITLIPDMINAIAALIASGATKELPEVTKEQDEGRVLMVTNGMWQAAELPPSGTE